MRHAEAALGSAGPGPRPSPCGRGRPRRSGCGRARRARRPDRLGQLLRIELLDQPLGQHGDAEVRPIARRLMIAPSTMSQMSAKATVPVGELLGDDGQRGAGGLADAEREVAGLAAHATTTYQRRVDRASSIRLRTSSTPTWRAVWKPKVGTCGGSGRSLSIVLGTWTLRIVPCDRSLTVARRQRRVVAADGHQVRDAGLLQRLDDGPHAPRRDLVGFSREVPRTEPPARWTRDTSSIASGRSSRGVARGPGT